MGLFDQLSDLDKIPKVTAPEPPKSVELAQPEIPAVKATTKKRAQPDKSISEDISRKLIFNRPKTRQRIITRASFEVYQDQLHVFRQVSLTAKLQGEKLSISEMVREALDSYLTDKNLT